MTPSMNQTVLCDVFQEKKSISIIFIFRFMCYDEFLGILTSADLITDEFPERDAITAFSQSMMTQVDEFDNDRHMKMQKVEYFEALARVAEGVSPAPPGANIEEWPLARRKEQLLADKMDNLIPALLNVAKKEFRERWRKPERDKSTGLYLTPADTQPKKATFYSTI